MATSPLPSQLQKSELEQNLVKLAVFLIRKYESLKPHLERLFYRSVSALWILAGAVLLRKVFPEVQPVYPIAASCLVFYLVKNE